MTLGLYRNGEYKDEGGGHRWTYGANSALSRKGAPDIYGSSICAALPPRTLARLRPNTPPSLLLVFRPGGIRSSIFFATLASFLACT